MDLRRRKIAMVVTVLAVASASAFSLRSDTPARGNYFATQSPGEPIPRSDEECADAVRRHPWEPRPDNARANRTTPPVGTSFATHTGGDRRIAVLREKVTGNFTGTTDEIIQWASCKWGFDAYVVRAIAVQESWWHMQTVGDSGESVGLIQIRARYHGGCPTDANGKAVVSSPECWTHHSSALAMDLGLAILRGCFEGYWEWLNGVQPRNGVYRAGDLWGCMGAYYSGRWYDDSGGGAGGGANWYIERVRRWLANRQWARPDFGPGAEQFPW